MAFDIEAWSNYGVAIVGAAAALTGLLFVAVSINKSKSRRRRRRATEELALRLVRKEDVLL